MDHRDKIISIVREHGPSLPAQINKELRTNVLFASAMLAEMVDNKKLKLTYMKIGGSPLYYCAGQEAAIEQFAHKLQHRDYETFVLLKQAKVLRDRDQDTPTRVSLRELKDFAVALEVSADGYSDLFWKYYLVDDDSAKSLIKPYLDKVAVAKEKLSESYLPMSDISENEDSSVLKQQNISIPISSVSQQSNEFSYQHDISFSTVVKVGEKIKLERKKSVVVDGVEKDSVQKVLAFPEDDVFYRQIKSFFDASGIDIIDFILVRKSSEYDFVIRLPSNVGVLEYYCKAKSKSKINEGDLSTAFVQGQMRKLPILFLTVGDMTKRAKELLDKEFRSMFVKKI